MPAPSKTEHYSEEIMAVPEAIRCRKIAGSAFFRNVLAPRKFLGVFAFDFAYHTFCKTLLNWLNAVANRQDYLDRLRVAVQHLHKCAVLHQGTVPVHEVFRGKTVWKGEVEVFQMFGHPKTTRCYAWSHREGPNEENERFVAVLEVPPVDSAKRAVQVQIRKERESLKEKGALRLATVDEKGRLLKGFRTSIAEAKRALRGPKASTETYSHLGVTKAKIKKTFSKRKRY